MFFPFTLHCIRMLGSLFAHVDTELWERLRCCFNSAGFGLLREPVMNSIGRYNLRYQQKGGHSVNSAKSTHADVSSISTPISANFPPLIVIMISNVLPH